MKKSMLFIFAIISLGLFTACGSNSATPETLHAEDQVATIVAGTLSALPTNTSLPMETIPPEASPTEAETPTSEVSPTPSLQCKGELSGIILTMPNNSWSCLSAVLENGMGGMEVIDVYSQVFKIQVAYRAGRGLWCEPNQNENCVVTSFYKNEMVELSLYKWHGENKEIFGQIQRSEGAVIISVKFTNMDARDLTQIEIDELVRFIDSIIFEHE